MDALLEWDCRTMQQALDLFYSAGMDQLGRYGGYMVEERQGYLQAAFCQPANAVYWADGCVQALLNEKWWVGLWVGVAGPATPKPKCKITELTGNFRSCLCHTGKIDNKGSRAII